MALHDDRIPLDDLHRMGVLRAFVYGEPMFDEQAQDLRQRGWVKFCGKRGVIHFWRPTRLGRRELALYEKYLAEAS